MKNCPLVGSHQDGRKWVYVQPHGQIVGKWFYGSFGSYVIDISNGEIDVMESSYHQNRKTEEKGTLLYVDDEEEEQVIEVCCPKCGEKRITTPNTGITCKGCRVRIVVGANGEIRRVI